MTFPILVFVAALAVIASERVDRTKVALTGAVLLLLTQTIEQHQAIEAIDWNTLGLLVGMMLMVKITETTGAYTWLAIRAGQRRLGAVDALAGDHRQGGHEDEDGQRHAAALGAPGRPTSSTVGRMPSSRRSPTQSAIGPRCNVRPAAASSATSSSSIQCQSAG